MKYSKTKTIGKAGVIYIEDIVNSHGSVFRSVHQEDDFGIDGYIELVDSEVVSGRLIAVQIKAGDSYLSKDGMGFKVDVDKSHLDYWRNYMVPVVLICYSPSKNSAAWVSIRDYVEEKEYESQLPIKNIIVPFSKEFNKKTLSEGIAALAHARADERLLIKCADMCLNSDSSVRRQGFEILSQHPDSRDLKVTFLLAKRLILDEDVEIAKDALFILGYGVGRQRWSWNPNNKHETEVIEIASNFCADLNSQEICRLVDLVDDEAFNGPEGLGERCFDVLSCCFDEAAPILRKIASDKALPMQRRANALYLLYECDDEALEEAVIDIIMKPELKDVVYWMFKDSLDELLKDFDDLRKSENDSEDDKLAD